MAGPVRRSWFQVFLYESLRGITWTVGGLCCRLRVRGAEWVPEDGGVLVCSNHQSYFDPVLVGVTSRRRMNFLARRSLFRFPVFGTLIKLLGAIPIDREGTGMEGFRESLRRLRRGEMLLIFPEGTRTRDGELGTLKNGFCALARRGKAALLPVAIDGAYQAWPRTARLPRPHRITVVVGQPISPEEVAELDDDQLVEEVARRLRACHHEASGKHPPTPP